MGFIVSFWKWITGTPLVPQVFLDMRWDSCKNCPHKKKGWIREYCEVCFCTVSNKRHIGNKLAHADEECPKLYWPKVEVNR